ncbi:MAG: glycosyltransferase family 2 protein [Balneolales bacterium]|nr:glycosyltransferase family 2 protein [Balneolales bacterium]
MKLLPKVAVLMSTYNGEKFIREQLNSIVSQRDISMTLFVRDDGSTDQTCEIIAEYSIKYSNISFEKGSNLGVVGSFFRLMSLAGDSYDYYAFADQDDVWLDEKLSRAVHKMKSATTSEPKMYYSRLEFVSEDLQHLGYSIIPTTNGFHNALVQNQATGCTVVLNRSARNCIVDKLPSWSLMHDWWCYLVVSAFGTVVYDDEPFIRYRKHGNNVTPATPNFAMELYARTRRFLGEGNIPEKVTDQAREFLKLFGSDLTPERRHLAEGFIEARSRGVIGRLQYAMKMPVRRNTGIDNLIMRVLIVIGRF